jgi:hypothetical protein
MRVNVPLVLMLVACAGFWATLIYAISTVL